MLGTPNQKYDYRDFHNGLKDTKLGFHVLKRKVQPDARLPAYSRGLGILVRDQAIFFPESLYKPVDFMQAQAGGWELLIISDPETDALRMFRRYVDGRVLEFETDGKSLRDKGTGSTWDYAGVCIEGALQGTRLERPAYTQAYWYAWAAFHPRTLIAEAIPAAKSPPENK